MRRAGQKHLIMLSFLEYRTLRWKNWTSRRKSKLTHAQCSGLAQAIVDADFYNYRYPDVAKAGMDPYQHFMKFGWYEGRDPNPFTHTKFVKRLYPDVRTGFECLAETLTKPIYHNALMRVPATLETIHAAAEVGNSAYSELFRFDVETYCRAQRDVALVSHLNPIQHLFYDGLIQNRLRRDNHLSPVFNDVFDYATDYDFLVAQDKPLEITGFRTLSLSTHLQEATLNVSDVVLGVGTLLYNNSPREIARLLLSVEANFKESSFPCRLHIWDNSPEPMNVEQLQNIGPELDIHFSAHPENPGFAKGHNGLMEECFSAGCTHYLGLNPDGHLLPGSIENAIRFARTKSGPSLIELDAEPLSHPKYYNPITGQTDWVSGAAFLLDAEAYSRTGGFDPEFPMYGEDVDLSFRAYQSGVELYVAPNARYYHDTSYRIHSFEPWRKYRSLIGTWYLCVKWGDTTRANTILSELYRQPQMDIPLPKRPDVVANVPPKITELLKKERFASSRFWGE